MIKPSVEHILRKNGALRTNPEGRTSIELLGLYVSAGDVSLLCCLLGQPFRDRPVDVVVSPEGRSFVLAHGVAQFLMVGLNRKVDTIWAGGMANHHYAIHQFARPLILNSRVLIVDDIVVSHDNRVKQVMSAIEGAGGQVVGVAAIYGDGTCFDQLPERIEKNLLLPALSYQEAKAA